MRINLSFKDAVITQISECEMKIVFDLSTMNQPRLSPDARMYIEHFNLCEFRDEAYGEKGNLRGYFELRCQNIQNNDWDSENGTGGNCVLYRSPLSSFHNFTNNDPMLISNFKINQGFLSNQLVMFLKFFDQKGNPYTTSSSYFSEININSAEYSNHIDAIKELDTSFKQREPVLKRIEETSDLLKQQHVEVSIASNNLQKAQTVLFKKFDSYIARKSTNIRSKIRLEAFRLLIEKYSVNDTIYIFEGIKYSLSGYKNTSAELQSYYQAFVDWLEETHIEDQFQINLGNLESSTTEIFDDFDADFDPISVLVKADTQIGIPYEVTVPGGTNKEGTLTISYFNAPSTNDPKMMITVDDIIQTVGSLNKNDVLEIDESIFDSIVPEVFTYRFVKDEDTVTGLDMVFKDTTGASFSESRKQDLRFSLEVVRNASDYTVSFTDLILNFNGGYSEGFEDGDKIEISGVRLDGVAPGNNLTITIGTVKTYATNITKPFLTLDDGDNTKGTVNIEIEIDNTAVNDYTLAVNDLTSTSNFKIGDEFLIKGSLLNGNDGLLADGGNDCILKVDDVIEAEVEYTIDDTNSAHSIEIVQIGNTNSTITKGDGTAIPSGGRDPLASAYRIDVSSLNGVYVATFDPSSDTSAGFENDDIIVIDGSNLGGITGTNDLKIQVQADPASGKITSAVVEPTGSYVARKATGYDFKVYVKNNVTDYVGQTVPEIDVSVIGNDFALNDTITVKGSKLGGADGGAGVGNDLVLTISNLTGSPPTALVITHTGTPNNPTGNDGQILTLSFKEGQNRFFDNIGEIDRTSITKLGTVVDITTITKPKGKITLLSDAFEKSRDVLNAEIATRRATVLTTKNALVPINSKLITSISDHQKDKVKAMHMSMVLYDEIPEYTQSSYDAISGNTYSRVMNCQFKRI